VNVAVFDYGAGNLHSLVKAVTRDGWSVRVESDPRRAVAGDVLILPGVGAFGQAASALQPGHSIVAGALRSGHPCLGICLGMQLLFEGSDEGPGAGLGIFAGRVTRIAAQRVPHIGWNTLDQTSDPLFARSRITTAYFANGFVGRAVDPERVIAWSTHETDRFPAAVRAGRVLGVQFHPEKSSGNGIRFLHAALDELAS
jgi:imidazole glycerol-phosphate synthase subunit HisH